MGSAPDRSLPALPSPLRIAVWNTRKFEHEGAGGLLRELAAHSDLLMLQESRIDAPDTAQRWRLFASGYRRSSLHSGVELRAPVPADARCALQFREPWLRTAKAAAVARFNLHPDASLLVITLHAINFTLGSAAYSAQLGALGQVLDAHPGPALVAGDFNHWNPARVRALQQFMSHHGLRALGFQADLRSRHLGHPVDEILLRGIAAIDATARPTQSSDHHPLTATLLWPPPPPRPHAGVDNGAAEN